MTKKWLSGDSPKVTPKVTFWPEKRLKSDLFGSKSHFRGHFWATLGESPESHFLVTFELLWFFRGLGACSRFPRWQPHKRLSKMISLNAKNLESILLAEPHIAVMFSSRTLTRSAKVADKTLQIAEPKPWMRRRILLPNPGMPGPFENAISGPGIVLLEGRFTRPSFWDSFLSSTFFVTSSDVALLPCCAPDTDSLYEVSFLSMIQWRRQQSVALWWQRKPKMQIFAASRRFSQIHPFSWKFNHLLVPTLCRADLGWIFYFGPANFRKIAGEFLSEFWWRTLIANFSALFFKGFRPPKKFTPKIHVQNCRHSSPISPSWTQNLFTAIFSAYGGDQAFGGQRKP